MAQDPPTTLARPTAKPVRVRFDRFELDEENATLTGDGKAIPVAPTPFAVLCALVRQEGLLVTKNALLDEVWGHRFVTESVLKTVIGKLRTALGDDARQPRFIETVSRRGYRFIGRTVPTGAKAALRLPGAPADASFIGRADALSRLESAWDRACAGQRAIVWIAGEAGIGKTTLINRFVSSLGDASCARGQCVAQYGAGEPYMPVLEALGRLCRTDPTLVTLLRAVAPTWLLSLPWLLAADERAALHRELVGVGPERMLREMGELLERYTAERPLLLVTEDLHWSDRATTHLLDYLARRNDSSRFMWLASFRLSEAVALEHPLGALRRELRLHELCEEIVLDPFSESEIEQFVAQRAPSIAPDEGLVRALHERTDGVPLFVAQILVDLARGSGQASDAGSPAERIARMAVPENLAGIIHHYFDKLPDAQRDLLSAAAVCGVEFRLKTLAGVVGSDEAAVAQACDSLVRDDLWLTASSGSTGDDGLHPHYAFKHALFHQVVHERTNAAARADLHRKAGLALERERTDGATITPAQLAMHFERGGEPLAAVRYYAEAAETALLHFSPAEATSLAERGLKVLAQAARSAERNDLEITLATLEGVSAAHLRGVSSDAAKIAYERADALLPRMPAHRHRELLLHGLGLTLCVRGDYPQALAFAERCAALAASTNDPVALLGACTVHGEVDMLQGRPQQAREWAERGLSIIESLHAPSEEALAPQITLLGLLAMDLLHLGSLDDARAKVREARERADAWGQPLALSIAIWFEALLEVRLGDAERVAGLAAQMEALVDKHALAQGRAAGRWFRGWALARTGQAREGFALIRSAYEENSALGMRAGGSEVVGYAAEALLLAGDLQGAQAQLDEALAISRGLGERVYLPQLLVLQSEIARARGNVREATASARRALEEARAQQAPWLELVALLPLCEELTANREDRRSLEKLVESLSDAQETGPVARARRIVARA
ncbi:MAG TPA: AAA family ATPase [Usitatibacter sp.]|nr:AAA family ATPase [Usitatibacter sp.]